MLMITCSGTKLEWSDRRRSSLIICPEFDFEVVTRTERLVAGVTRIWRKALMDGIANLSANDNAKYFAHYSLAAFLLKRLRMTSMWFAIRRALLVLLVPMGTTLVVQGATLC